MVLGNFKVIFKELGRVSYFLVFFEGEKECLVEII